MLRYFLAYLAALVVMPPLDITWLRTMNAIVYRPDIGELLTDRPVIGAAVAFYILYAAAVVVFATQAGWRNESWFAAALTGAFLGLVAYATYDLTNMATLKIWTLRVTLVDVGWGIVITAISASASYFASRLVAP